MALVTVAQARPGMVLSTAVQDQRGRLLVAAGTELGERHVKALQMWGITHLEIEGEEPEGETVPALHPETVALVEVAVDEQLGDNDPKHPFVAALRRHAVKRRVESIAHGTASL